MLNYCKIFSTSAILWTDLKLSPDQKWMAGGYGPSDHDIEALPAEEVLPEDYKDMSPMGIWMPNIPAFNDSATDDDKLGIGACATVERRNIYLIYPSAFYGKNYS